MNFGTAFEAIKAGEAAGMRLPGWSPDVIIKVQRPDANSKMTAPYLYVESRFGLVPWKETMIELFADHWQLVNTEEWANLKGTAVLENDKLKLTKENL